MTDTEIVTPQDVTVASATRAWVALLPDLLVPDESELYRWLSTAGNDRATLFSAIGRAAYKRQKQARHGFDMNGDDVCRYVTATIIHKRKESHTAPVNLDHLDVATEVTAIADGDRLTIKATRQARKVNRVGIRRLA
jgi:hypothetical protein